MKPKRIHNRHEHMVAAAMQGNEVTCVCSNRDRAHYERMQCESFITNESEWTFGIWRMKHRSGGEILFTDANNPNSTKGLNPDAIF